MSDPAPEIIIREAIALSSCDPDGACPSVCGSVPPIDNCLRHQAISAVRQLVRERDEARAEIERLRAENAWRASETEMLDRLEVLALDAAYSDAFVGLQLRAALAAAQEPPADECSYCGLTLEPGETHAQHPDAGCVAQEPPAKGGDRDE